MRRALAEISQALDADGVPHLTLTGSLSDPEALRSCLRQPGNSSTDGTGSLPWSADEVLWLASLSDSFADACIAAGRHMQQALGAWAPRRSGASWDGAQQDLQRKLQLVRARFAWHAVVALGRLLGDRVRVTCLC